jgi:3-oxoadipate enol-lactonase
MDRCSALTVTGHEDFAFVRSLGNPEKALLNLSMTTATANAAIEAPLKYALENGITEDEIQDIVNFAWSAGHADRATELSRLVARHRGFDLPETSIVKLSDHETLVRDTAPNSTGVPIVLLHALTYDGSMWGAIYPSLSKAARVIMYDIRGFGFARDAPLTTSIDQLADDLNSLLDSLNIVSISQGLSSQAQMSQLFQPVSHANPPQSQADICGISYGGVIAQTFALRHPSSTRSVAVLGSLPKGSPILLDRAATAEAYGMESLVSPTLTRWFSADAIASNPWQVRYGRTCIRRAKVENWAAAWRHMASFDVVDRLAEIKVPVLAVAGAKDVSTPPPLLKLIAERTRGKYVELPEGTHMMNLEQAEEVVEVLTDFRHEVDSKVGGVTGEI